MAKGFVVVMSFHHFGSNMITTIVGSNVSDSKETARKYAEYLASANNGAPIEWDSWMEQDGSTVIDDEGYSKTEEGFINFKLKEVNIIQ